MLMVWVNFLVWNHIRTVASHAESPCGRKNVKRSRGIAQRGCCAYERLGPQVFIVPSHSRAQRNGDTIAMYKADHWCPEPVIGLGLAKRIPYFLAGHHRYPDSVKDLRAGSEWCRKMPHFKYGIYKGILLGPLHNCRFTPDIIIIHVNGMMASMLLNVRNWIGGKDVYSQLSGHAACVYALVPPLLKYDCQIAIPCKGDRKNANAQDDEILFSMVTEMLPLFIEGMRWLEDHGWSIPLSQEYKEEYDLKDNYKHLAERIGMDMRKSLK